MADARRPGRRQRHIDGRGRGLRNSRAHQQQGDRADAARAALSWPNEVAFHATPAKRDPMTQADQPRRSFALLSDMPWSSGRGWSARTAGPGRGGLLALARALLRVPKRWDGQRSTAAPNLIRSYPLAGSFLPPTSPLARWHTMTSSAMPPCPQLSSSPSPPGPCFPRGNSKLQESALRWRRSGGGVRNSAELSARHLRGDSRASCGHAHPAIVSGRRARGSIGPCLCCSWQDVRRSPAALLAVLASACCP